MPQLAAREMVYLIFTGAVMQGVSLTATLIHADGFSIAAILPAVLAAILCGPFAWRFMNLL